MLSLYREALRLRGSRWVEADGLAWIDAPSGVLAFARGDLQCWLNAAPDPVRLPQGQVLLSSGQLIQDGALPADTAVWLVES
jgi:alpha-glucosidase